MSGNALPAASAAGPGMFPRGFTTWTRLTGWAGRQSIAPPKLSGSPRGGCSAKGISGVMISGNDKVCVIGIWHLGSVASACLAEAGYRVVGVDGDAKAVGRLNKGVPPIFEPGLEDLVKRNLDAKRLGYTTDLASALKGAKYVLVAFDTPVNVRDEVDLSPVLA